MLACLCGSRRSLGGKPSSLMVHHSVQAYLHKRRTRHCQAWLTVLLGHLPRAVREGSPLPRTVNMASVATKNADHPILTQKPCS